MSRDTNFYYSFLVLPPDKRRAIVAVWDFCRAVDDAADEPVSGEPAVELAMWRREVAAWYEGATPATSQGRTLAPLVHQFRLPREAFEAIIEGVEMDVGDRRYDTFDELYQYCIRVASAVGLVCLEIFGYRDPGARQYATDLGVALQLTNILRDVAEDLKRGRVYLPQEDLRAHGVSEADLQVEARRTTGSRSVKVAALLRQQAARARAYYARADGELPPADRQTLVAAKIMGAVYQAILDRIEARDYDVFSSVVRVPRPRRALIAATTWLGTLVGR
ncbi:MAG: presqualene diphosphate synthase HpnD [Vicinamibacterales bacterium]